jgi:C4-dicarboxylate-specific signal transduction histidine kinase
MKDTPSENRVISIRTSRVEKFAELSVSDCGPGIPEDKIKEVFEPFFTSKAEGAARVRDFAHRDGMWLC